MRSDARKRSDNLSLRRGAGVVPSPGGDAITPAVVALTDAERREFQSIPDQGYSHRAWVDQKIAERLAAAGVVSDAAAEVECGCPASSGLGYKFHRYPCRNAGRIDDHPAAVSGVAASKADTDEDGA